MKLTDTQLALLSAASQREDRGLEPPANLNGGAAQKLVRKLLIEGLIEEVRAVDSLPVWRRDDDSGPLALRITSAVLLLSRSTRAVRSRRPGPIRHLTSLRGGWLLLVARRPGPRLRNSRRSPAAGLRSRPG
jgi:hypothetical protein